MTNRKSLKSYFRTSAIGGFTLVELVVSMALMSVVSIAMIQLIKSSLEKSTNERIKMHQRVALNTYVDFFIGDAEAAYRISWDNVNNNWIMFENNTHVTRYSQESDALNPSGVLLYRETFRKPNDNNVLLALNSMPPGWTPETRQVAHESMPNVYQDKTTFTCESPCFEFRNQLQVVLNSPSIEIAEQDPSLVDLITLVFGRIRYEVPDVIITKTFVAPIT
jgi:prepilin-type N-terminal cleavage/methylation domain-containing protein